jgi:hypothetical protein
MKNPVSTGGTVTSIQNAFSSRLEMTDTTSLGECLEWIQSASCALSRVVEVVSLSSGDDAWILVTKDDGQAVRFRGPTAEAAVKACIAYWVQELCYACSKLSMRA